MNKIDRIMTKNPVCCTRETKIEQVANMMLQHDCGEIPVVESQQGKKLIGVITDRDIVIRSLARGINPLELSAEDCMTANPISIKRDVEVDLACQLMEDNQIRRIPVVDDQENVVGMLSQADLATTIDEEEVGTIVKNISQPGRSSTLSH